MARTEKKTPTLKKAARKSVTAPKKVAPKKPIKEPVKPIKEPVKLRVNLEWQKLLIDNEKATKAKKLTDPEMTKVMQGLFPEKKDSTTLSRVSLVRCVYNSGANMFQKMGPAGTEERPTSRRYDENGEVIARGSKTTSKTEVKKPASEPTSKTEVKKPASEPISEPEVKKPASEPISEPEVKKPASEPISEPAK